MIRDKGRFAKGNAGGNDGGGRYATTQRELALRQSPATET